jgi:23S rRNA pseudouridine2604 synthase
MELEGKRINKYISDAGVCSRREADRLIEAGRVEIRRKSRKGEEEHPLIKAQTGDRVFHGDTVYVNGRELPKKEQEKIYILYNKPKGVICTLDESVRGSLAEAVKLPPGVSYAGRLDKDSEGLLLLTNDGSLSDLMMRASSCHEKEYHCTVDHTVTEEFLTAMKNGVKILLDDETTLRKHPHGLYVTTRPCKVKRTGDNSFSIVLTQGFNRQIRRMCKALGYSVTSLVRTRLLYLRLGDLKSGQMKLLNGAEAERLRKTVYESSQPDSTDSSGSKSIRTSSRSGGAAKALKPESIRTSSQSGRSAKTSSPKSMSTPSSGAAKSSSPRSIRTSSYVGGGAKSHTESGYGRHSGRGGKGKTGTGRKR